MTAGWLYILDEKGLTPFDRAAGSNHMALTEVLLRRDAEDRSPSTEGSSPLHKATYLGLEDAVDSLIAAGADVNGVDKYGETPLHKAVRQGHDKIVSRLLEKGANINAVDTFGLSPLHWVAVNGHVSLAELLILKGADPNLPNERLDDLTPMDLAQIMGYEEIIRIFKALRPQ